MQWRMVNSLFLATIIRIGLVVVSYGAKVPAGIFVPSMAVGAYFGRMVGILVRALYRRVLEKFAVTRSLTAVPIEPTRNLASSLSARRTCPVSPPALTRSSARLQPSGACNVPAEATSVAETSSLPPSLSGVMRITVTVVVIMFELTGALTYILPTMVSGMISGGGAS